MAGIDLILNVKNKINEALGRADSQVDKWRSNTQKKLDSVRMPALTMGGGLSSGKMAVIDEMRSRIPELDSSLALAGSSAAFLSAGIVAVGAGLAYSTKLAYEWEKGMALVNTTASRDLKEMNWTLDDLSGKLRKIGREAPVDIMEIPQAYNKIISSGLDVKTSLEALNPTLLASKAGFTDLETTAKAMAQTMGGTGIKDATKVYDVLFATQRKGNVGFQEVAQFFPKLISGSKTLGLSFEQTAGSWAFLTTKMSAEQSTTGLQNLTKALADGRIQKAFKANKVQIFNKDGSVKEMLDIVKQVKDKTAGLSDKGRTKFMDALGLDMEASSAMSAMVSDVDYLKSSISEVKNSAGSLNKAFLDSATSMDMMTMLGNKFKYDLMGAGDDILLVLKPVLKWVYENYDNIKIALLNIGTLGFYQLYKVAYDFRHNIMASIESIKTYFTVSWTNIKTIYQGIAGMAGGIGKILTGMKNRNLDEIQSGISEVRQARDNIKSDYIGGAKKSQMVDNSYKLAHVNSRLRENKERADLARSGNNADNVLNPTGPGADYNANRKDRASGAQDSISSSTKTINITVNGGMVSGGIEINVTELSKDMGWAQIEDKIGEVIMKTIRNIEVNY